MALHNDGPVFAQPDREISYKDVKAGMVVRIKGASGYSEDVFLVVVDPGEYGHVDLRAFSLIDGWESSLSDTVLDVTGTVRLYTMKPGGQ